MEEEDILAKNKENPVFLLIQLIKNNAIPQTQ